MCGVAGVIALTGEGRDNDAFARRAAAALHQRGPDASGTWSDPSAGVALAHARLSILDLSPAGAQPMVSPNGRFVIVFNGEIYNHSRLRDELVAAGLAPEWRGHSDTETLLACFEAWGIPATIERAVGMFAMGVWDTRSRSLTLVRDRLGEKPLYYGRLGPDFVFASELKALWTHSKWSRSVDRDSLALLLRFNYIPSPFSIQQGIAKLPPGSMVTVSRERPDVRPTEYWSIQGPGALEARRSLVDVSDGEAIDKLDALLRDAVHGQMISDVPLGAFLSGGCDSSLVVGLMQSMSSRPVRTFSLGFVEEEFDEAGRARAVARHLGTEHTEFVLTSDEARRIIPTLPEVYDEPFADSSQIPTVMVSRLARQGVTVALTGDGADELFGGYGRYALGRSPLHHFYRVPRPLRNWAARSVDWVRERGLGHAAGASDFRWARRFNDDRLDKLAVVLAGASPDEIGLQQASQWPHPERLVLGARRVLCAAERASDWLTETDPTARLMMVDLISYLPGDILTKVDRAAMSVSLETRVPFLDHRVVEFALGLPMRAKVRGGRGKWILRELLGRYVPPALTERPKMGFSIPVDRWMRGPLRDWVEGLIGEDRLKREGHLDPTPIRRAWQQHLSGRANWHLHLWSVLMFQAWLDSSPSGPARDTSV